MRFIGCKENLLPFIEGFIDARKMRGDVFCDIFSGTTSVARHFKRRGYKVISNDLLYFSYVLQRAYVTNTKYPKFAKLQKHLDQNLVSISLFDDERMPLELAIRHLDSLDPVEGYAYHSYSPEGTAGQEHERRYFTGENARRIDAIRECIEDWNGRGLLAPDEYFILLAALIEAIPFVSNISGTYGAFLKTWDPRAHKRLSLQVPEILDMGSGHRAFNADFNDIVDDLSCDILYIDPPYNERQYAPNYHVLETIARWDKPTLKGKTGQRPYMELKSQWCTHDGAAAGLDRIASSAKYKHLLLSYSDEGLLSVDEVLTILGQYGKVEVVDTSYQRFKSHSHGLDHKQVSELLFYLKPVHPKNTLNDLSGSEWLYFLNSVEVTAYPASGPESYARNIRSVHPSPKPPQLMQKLIEFFTKDGGRVLDPFVGVGGTLLGCSLSNRHGVGVDLSEEYLAAYRHASDVLGLERQVAISGDSRELPSLLVGAGEGGQFDLILTDPPYSEMLSKVRTGERSKKGFGEASPFTDSSADLGNLSYDEFFGELKSILSTSLEFLKDKGYVVVFCKDMQPTREHHFMLHCDIVRTLSEIPELSYKGYKIWYDKTQNLYPFGYPHAFVANQFHQFILVFRKEPLKAPRKQKN